MVRVFEHATCSRSAAGPPRDRPLHRARQARGLARFCFRRVKIAKKDGIDPANHEAVWLLIEWPEGETKATKFSLTTLPRRMSKKQIIIHWCK